MSGYRAAIRALRENYETMDENLRREVDAKCEILERKHQERVGTAGRKPLSPALVRSHKILLSLNESEYRRVLAALEKDSELASGVRALALKAADEIARRREN